mmetsp:Transcript_23549/g.38367  ORF Transcript_23549/g.38367 Transcript_23549/m.38367 type:complete len:105 (-) Transcript_23549:359-673(-)
MMYCTSGTIKVTGSKTEISSIKWRKSMRLCQNISPTQFERQFSRSLLYYNKAMRKQKKIPDFQVAWVGLPRLKGPLNTTISYLHKAAKSKNVMSLCASGRTISS